MARTITQASIDKQLRDVRAEMRTTPDPEQRETLAGLIDRLLDERNALATSKQ